MNHLVNYYEKQNRILFSCCSLFLIILSVFIFIACSGKHKNLLQTEAIQLASPQIFIDSIFFKNTAQVELRFDVDDANIFYTINQNPPKIYKAPFQVSQSSEISIQSKKKGYIESEAIIKNLFRVSEKRSNATIRTTPNAHETYPGEGASSLFDLKKGTTDFRQGLFWSGFQSKKLIIEIEFNEPAKAEEVVLSLLSDHPSWIFLPEDILIFSDKKEIGHKHLAIPKEEQSATLAFITIPIAPAFYSHIEIHIMSDKGIPSWHQGKGAQAWLFIDEILIN